MTKVLGLMMARNESHLISVSISHALNNFCDQIIVLAHDSTPAFKDEVLQLSCVWPNKIVFLNLNRKVYQQKKLMRILCFIAAKLDFDWIYPVDADEFGLSSDPSHFREYLNNLDSGVTAVRYEIENWISERNFKCENFNSFLQINQRSIPAINLNLDAITMRTEIVNGNFNYFDFAFDSKVIFRNRSSYVLDSGAHRIDSLPADQEHQFPKDVFKVAHLPLLSRERLNLRAEQGKKLIQEGFLPWHGWQSQMVYDIDKAGKLDDFWIRHSASIEEAAVSGTPYSSESDSSFARAIEQTIKFLKNVLGDELSTSASFKDIDEFLDLYDFLDLDEILIQASKLSGSAVAERDSAVAERDSAVAERDSVVAERDSAVAERDSAVAERDSAVAERDSAVAEHDSAVAERDSAVAEHDSAVAERDSAVAERDSVLNSTIWKMFKPYRKLRNIFLR